MSSTPTSSERLVTVPTELIRELMMASTAAQNSIRGGFIMLGETAKKVVKAARPLTEQESAAPKSDLPWASWPDVENIDEYDPFIDEDADKDAATVLRQFFYGHGQNKGEARGAVRELFYMLRKAQEHAKALEAANTTLRREIQKAKPVLTPPQLSVHPQTLEQDETQFRRVELPSGVPPMVLQPGDLIRYPNGCLSACDVVNDLNRGMFIGAILAGAALYRPLPEPKESAVREHRLKTWPGPFQAMKAGDKTAEFRRNDRDFQVGDTLVLLEWDPESKSLTGDELRFRATHVLDGGQFGMPKDYVMISVAALSNVEEVRKGA